MAKKQLPWFTVIPQADGSYAICGYNEAIGGYDEERPVVVYQHELLAKTVARGLHEEKLLENDGLVIVEDLNID